MGFLWMVGALAMIPWGMWGIERAGRSLATASGMGCKTVCGRFFDVISVGLMGRRISVLYFGA